MKIGNNHKIATPSVEADNIEGDIESIERNIVTLTHEFLNRVKKTFSIQRILENNLNFIIFVIFLILGLIFPLVRRKTLKVKIVRVDK